MSKKILTFDDLIKLSLDEIDNISISEYSTEELNKLIEIETQLVTILHENNISTENKGNIPVIELIGDNYVN